MMSQNSLLSNKLPLFQTPKILNVLPPGGRFQREVSFEECPRQ